MKKVEFTCIINVYNGTVLEFFKTAIYSIVEQTVIPDELIIVIDGPIYTDLDAFIANFIENGNHPFPVEAIRNEKNIGGGASRNVGFQNAKFEWVAIMDCDDYCVKNRFEKQINAIHQYSDVDFVCTLSDEYNDDFISQSYVATKKCPEFSKSIKRRLNYNCCITHPTILLKREVWKTVGGYAEYKFINDDHAFFLKIAKAGYKFYCVQEALLKVRIGKAQSKRRRGMRLFVEDFKFRYYCLKNGLMDIKGFSLLLLLFIRRFTPSFLLSYAHKLWRAI